MSILSFADVITDVKYIYDDVLNSVAKDVRF